MTRFVPDGVPCLTQRVTVRLGTWHLLVGCMMLNRTERRQAWRALDALFDLAPGPEGLTVVPDDALREILRPCGFGERRLIALRALTEDWLEGVPIADIRHVGRYALDSHAIFCRGERPDPETVQDHQLQLFLEGEKREGRARTGG